MVSSLRVEIPESTRGDALSGIAPALKVPSHVGRCLQAGRHFEVIHKAAQTRCSALPVVQGFDSALICKGQVCDVIHGVGLKWVAMHRLSANESAKNSREF